MSLSRAFSLLLMTAVAPVLAGNTIDIADRDADALAAAIHQANQSTGETTIRLARGGLYFLATAADDARELGLPTITGKVVLHGNDAELRRYSNEDFALLAVAKGGQVHIDSLTMAEGSRGALVNHGDLWLDRVRVVDNVAKNVPAIIENYGRLRVISSEISFNQLAATQRDAGTVLNYGTLELARSSIESNWISRRYDSLIAASAVLNLGELKLVGVSIRENTANADQDNAALGAIVNAGNGAYEGSEVTLENNDPVDTVTAARLAN